MVRAADRGGATFLDIAADPELVKLAKSLTNLPICVSAVEAAKFVPAIEAGADLIENRKSGNFTAGVGRQYIGEIGKTDNGVVTVPTHLYDGKKNLPLDIELYQPASSLPEGK